MKITLTAEQSREVLDMMLYNKGSIVYAQPFRKEWPDQETVEVKFTAIPKEKADKIIKILK